MARWGLLIVAVYGGPHVQAVQESWALTVDMRAQYLRQGGFAVLKLDNRGSARRGLAFESAIYLRTGHAEVEDQVTFPLTTGLQGLAGVKDVRATSMFGFLLPGSANCIFIWRNPRSTSFGAAFRQ